MPTPRKGPDPSRVLNFTTTISVERSIYEVTQILIAHEATSITTHYDQGMPDGVTFNLRIGSAEPAFRILSNWKKVRARIILYHNKGKRLYARGYWTEKTVPASLNEQARRTSWRIIKDAVEVMLNLSDAGIADAGQVLFGFGLLDSGLTIYDGWLEHQDALPAG